MDADLSRTDLSELAKTTLRTLAGRGYECPFERKHSDLPTEPLPFSEHTCFVAEKQDVIAEKINFGLTSLTTLKVHDPSGWVKELLGRNSLGCKLPKQGQRGDWEFVLDPTISHSFDVRVFPPNASVMVDEERVFFKYALWDKHLPILSTPDEGSSGLSSPLLIANTPAPSASTSQHLLVDQPTWEIYSDSVLNHLELPPWAASSTQRILAEEKTLWDSQLSPPNPTTFSIYQPPAGFRWSEELSNTRWEACDSVVDTHRMNGPPDQWSLSVASDCTLLQKDSKGIVWLQTEEDNTRSAIIMLRPRGPR